MKRAWALLAAVSVLAAALAGGHRYFYCAKMASAALVACCPHEGVADADSSIEPDACCHATAFASPDPGFAPAPRGVASAPFVAVAPTPTLDSRVPTARSIVEVRSARAGPALGSAKDYRLRLTVSLT